MVLVLIIILIVLMLISGFFSCAETAMMSLNRYKLRHLVRKKHLNAKRAQHLLSRTDKLLSVILLGNTFANIFASAITTILAERFFGELGVLLVTVGLTLIILLFAEIIPKTYSALYPEKIAYPIALPLTVLLKILYPLAWVLNSIAVTMFKFFGIAVLAKGPHESLTGEELRTVVSESGASMNLRHQHMLLGVLDLDHANLLDVMIPRQQILGLDLSEPWEVILEKIQKSPYSKMPVYRDHLDNLIGILHLRRMVALINQGGPIGPKDIENLLEKPYFIPEMISLQKQLIEFQKNGEHFGLVVDEYGDIQGMVTLEDIIEEIIGSLSNQDKAKPQKIIAQPDGSYFLSGSLSIRDLNRALGMQLPTHQSKTLSGLITEYLQNIPVPKTCVQLEQYFFEILETEDNAVKIAKLLKNP